MKKSALNWLAIFAIVSLALSGLVADPYALATCQGVKTWQQLRVLELSPEGEIAYSPDGVRLAVASRNNVVIWNTRKEEVESVLKGHTNSVTSVTWSPDSSKIASGSYDRTVNLWDVETEKLLGTLEGHPQEVTCVSWSPDGSKIVSADSYRAYIWEAETGELIRTLTFGNTRTGKQVVSWSPDGSKIATAGQIRIWDAETGEVITTFTSSDADFVSWSPDGSMIASAAPEGHYYSPIYIRDAETGDVIRRIGTSIVVESVSWSPDNVMIAGASGGGLGSSREVPIWDVETGRPITELFGHTSSVESVSWSPDAEECNLASAGSDRTVRIWGSAQ